VTKHLCRVRDSAAIRKSRDVEVIAYLIAPHDQVSLDPQNLVERRGSKHLAGRKLDPNYFQGPGPHQLAHARLDIAQLSKNDPSRRDSVSDPPIGGFDGLKDRVETRFEILKHMVVIA